MAANAVIQIGLALEDLPASVAHEIEQKSSDRQAVMRHLSRLLEMCGAGGQKHKLSVRVDSSTAGSTQFALSRASVTNTITQASLVATTDTLVIGGVVTLTWVVATANENQITIGASDTLCGDNLVTMINAHSKLSKLFVATNVSGVVTIQFRGDPRIGEIIAITETGNGQVLSATNFAIDTTDAASGTSYLYSDGGIGA
jgi:hypothetical protein